MVLRLCAPNRRIRCVEMEYWTKENSATMATKLAAPAARSTRNTFVKDSSEALRFAKRKSPVEMVSLTKARNATTATNSAVL